METFHWKDARGEKASLTGSDSSTCHIHASLSSVASASAGNGQRIGHTCDRCGTARCAVLTESGSRAMKQKMPSRQAQMLGAPEKPGLWQAGPLPGSRIWSTEDGIAVPPATLSIAQCGPHHQPPMPRAASSRPIVRQAPPAAVRGRHVWRPRWSVSPGAVPCLSCLQRCGSPFCQLAEGGNPLASDQTLVTKAPIRRRDFRPTTQDLQRARLRSPQVGQPASHPAA